MRNILVLTLCLFSIYSYAASSISGYLDNLPRKCHPKHIIREIPFVEPNWLELEFRQQFTESYINNYSHYMPLEVIDVKNVETVKRGNNQLVCRASLITDKGSRPYTITFSENSVGQIIVSHNIYSDFNKLK